MSKVLQSVQRRHHVLLVHGDVYAFGGAENHCVRIASIFQDAGWEVTILHAGGILDADRVEKWCGIRLDPKRVRFNTPTILKSLPRLFLNRALLRYALVARAAKHAAKNYDLVVATYGELSVNSKVVIQSLHVPLFFFDRTSLLYMGFGLHRGWLSHLARSTYVIASRALAGWNKSSVKKSRILTNSNWTAQQFIRHYQGCHVDTIYHGASTEITYQDNRYLDHSDRENNFVIIGRVVPSKNVDMALRIVDRVREEGINIGLYIIGNGDGGYADKICEAVNSRPYVKWYRGLNRKELEEISCRQKWGIHCAKYEHYGLAAIELQRLGCVTFVPNSCGQAEVVQDKRLKYENETDAVERIISVIRDEVMSREIFASLPDTVSLHEIAGHRVKFLEYLSNNCDDFH